MIVLKIEGGSGYFLRGDNEYCPITSISAEDIEKILGWILDTDDIAMDKYSLEEQTLKNPAEMIIYSNLYDRLDSTFKNRVKIIDAVNSEFKDAYEKYACSQDKWTGD